MSARTHSDCSYDSKQLLVLKFSMGFPYMLQIIWNTAQSEAALVTKLLPFTQLLLIKQRKSFNPSCTVCCFPFFHYTAAEPLPTENYAEGLSTAPSQSNLPSLCSHLWDTFPSSSPLGPARKENSVMAPWRENGGIQPMLCWW